MEFHCYFIQSITNQVTKQLIRWYLSIFRCSVSDFLFLKSSKYSRTPFTTSSYCIKFGSFFFWLIVGTCVYFRYVVIRSKLSLFLSLTFLQSRYEWVRWRVANSVKSNKHLQERYLILKILSVPGPLALNAYLYATGLHDRSTIYYLFLVSYQQKVD